MKRTYRNDMSSAQKEKLRAANIGKTLSQSTKQKISKSMEDYWRKLPLKPGTETGQTISSPFEDGE